MAISKRAPRKQSRRYHHGNLRQALVEEALATIRAEGVEALTLRQIGARLGVSRTALYRHFADKRALLTAVATEGFRILHDQLLAAWEANGRARSAFDAMGAAYIDFALANPSHYRVMFGRSGDLDDQAPEFAAEAEGAFQALADAIAALQQQAAVRSGDVAMMALFVWSSVHGLAMLAVDGHLLDRAATDELTRYAIAALWTGIEVRS